jgi:hypothetical protein
LGRLRYTGSKAAVERKRHLDIGGHVAHVLRQRRVAKAEGFVEALTGSGAIGHIGEDHDDHQEKKSPHS